MLLGTALNRLLSLMCSDFRPVGRDAGRDSSIGHQQMDKVVKEPSALRQFGNLEN